MLSIVKGEAWLLFQPPERLLGPLDLLVLALGPHKRLNEVKFCPPMAYSLSKKPMASGHGELYL